MTRSPHARAALCVFACYFTCACVDAPVRIDDGGTSSGTDGGSSADEEDAGDSDLDGGEAPFGDDLGRCRVLTVGGMPFAGRAGPGEELVLSAADVDPDNTDAAVTGALWSLLSRPPVADVSLANQAPTELAFSTDKSGEYVLGVVVIDDAGGARNVMCHLVIAPRADLSIELTWLSPVGDLDLHLMKASEDGTYCVASAGPGALASRSCGGETADGDCYFGNCKAPYGSVEWDSVEGPTNGDPVLIEDDLQGFGPEVIELEALSDGGYLVGVDVFSTVGWSDLVKATIKVFFQGQLVHTTDKDVSDTEWWEVVELTQQEGQLCVDSLDGAPAHCVNAPSCDASGCNFCRDDAGCGAGVRCASELEQCVEALAPCGDDNDCGDGEVCDGPSGFCLFPQCVDDENCLDSREVCDPDRHTCVLPPAQCEELDEPNNTLEDASPVVLEGTLSSTLCRGDVDVLALALEEGTITDLHLVVDMPSVGNRVALRGPDGTVIVEQTVWAESRFTLVTEAGEGGTYFVETYGEATAVDSWTYHLSSKVTPIELLSCDDEVAGGIEPNDTFATATLLEEGLQAFSRCGTGDVDSYRIEAPLGSAVEVKLASDLAEGSLRATLYGVVGEDLVLIESRRASASLERLRVSHSGGFETYLVEVRLDESSEVSEHQPYALEGSFTPGPASCDGDLEPDGELAIARPIAPGGSHRSISCAPLADVDYYRVEVPTGTAGDLRITPDVVGMENHAELLDEAGDLVFDYVSNGTILIPLVGGDESLVRFVKVYTESEEAVGYTVAYAVE